MIYIKKIYHYFWHNFCDKIIEEQKPRLYGENKKEKDTKKEKAANKKWPKKSSEKK